MEKGSWKIDLQELPRLVSRKTRAVIINTPSNPTGKVLDEKQVGEIIEAATENDLLVISDEAYEAIVYADVKHISIASPPEMKERIVSIFSFSKTYAMKVGEQDLRPKMKI